ncbi:hypothetical protein [Dinoroseobacter sp. S124A]|uniref:hypothetical protein n=1 Tax=Dinoroseobacter sp. S124A TaxID=3415128 RepID=UPI003C7A22A8
MTIEWEADELRGFEKFRLSRKDHALFFIENERDFEAQLYAIKAALSRNKEAEKKAVENIEHMRSQIDLLDPEDHRNADHLNDHLTDMFHESVYSDAAHSMSAVGMLAPFIESLFVAIFEAIRKVEKPTDEVDPRQNAFRDLYWNPQLVIKKGEFGNDLIRGIQELARFSGLELFLPDGYEKTLTALFAYRNNMFHNGFEWPANKVEKFQNRVKNKHWPENWFHHSSKNDVPWIYYMSEDFIQHCLKLIDEVLDGVGEYLEKREA